MSSLRCLSAFLLASSVASQVPIDVEFTEVLVDPVGANAGAQVAELTNRGPLAADLTGWYLATSAGAFALPSVTMPAQGIARLYFGQAGTSTQADIFLPSVPTLSSSDSLALFRSAATTNAADLVDFVSWGNGQGAIAVAVQAGQWPSLLETVQLPAQEGCTIAHYDRMVYGPRSRPEAWFRDCTPTLGATNDAGGIFAGAFGCYLQMYPPQIGSGEEDNRPWLGETWTLDVGYLPPIPTQVWVGVGAGSAATISLDPYGLTGCWLAVQPFAVLTWFLPPSQGQVQMALPNDPGLVGVELRLQGLVPFPGANPAGFLVTRVLHAHFGSR